MACLVIRGCISSVFFGMKTSKLTTSNLSGFLFFGSSFLTYYYPSFKANGDGGIEFPRLVILLSTLVVYSHLLYEILSGSEISFGMSYDGSSTLTTTFCNLSIPIAVGDDGCKREIHCNSFSINSVMFERLNWLLDCSCLSKSTLLKLFDSFLSRSQLVCKICFFWWINYSTDSSRRFSWVLDCSRFLRSWCWESP